jgi:hypothetical protein
MSDDLSPVDGCVHPDDAGRLAAGRTLVNLDTVDFAPILASLQCVAESARQCAGLMAAAESCGIAGSAERRLLSQTAERWSAFEAAVVGAGVVSTDLTTGTLLLTYDVELPMAEQRMAVVYELWDLISHHRRGRFDGADGLEMLAKQADAAAQLMSGLTPSETPPAEATPSEQAVSRAETIEAKAVATWFQHKDWTKKQIAEAIGCHEKQLSPKRCPTLAAAIQAYKDSNEANRRQVRGSKDKEGTVEAYEDEDE